MSEIASIAAAIFKHAGKSKRFVVAIAGAPGSGKSTLSANLLGLFPEGSAVVVPMDGFHYDDAILTKKELLPRKGAPETFDYAGFETLIRRIRAADQEVAIPVFDRTMELSRAAASIIGPDVKFVLVEGNYLLLDEAPWAGLSSLFDYSIFVEVERTELERRLIERWLDHDHTEDQARQRVKSNDLPNADRVLARRRAADMVMRQNVLS
jgi:pantothenate kinase